MSHQAYLEYIKAVKPAYDGASKNRKTQLLTHAQLVTKKDRKTIIRYLGRKSLELEQLRGFDGRGRPKQYDPEILLPHIKRLWIRMERISEDENESSSQGLAPSLSTS